MNVLNKAIALAFASVLAVYCLASCAPASNSSSGASAAGSTSAPATSAASSSPATPIVADCPTSHVTDFGGIFIEIPIDEFNARGFAFGDSVDIAFSNGFALANLPYYNGYYVNVGDPLLVGYPGSSYLKVCLNYGEDLWITAGFSEGDTATITLAQAGAYRDVQEALDISYTDVRADYPSDEAFANFRALTGGKLQSGVAYRAASPIDNKHARASYADTLMGDAGVQFVLDLSDNAEKVERYMAENRTAGIETPRFVDLYEKGQVELLNLGVNYHDDKFREALAAGLVSLSEHDGPYLVHCLEGKDRTGFVCALLEALAGATYQEIVDDYMITYANYYGTTRDGEPQKYEAIKNLNIDGMLYYVAGVDDGTNLQDVDLAQGARTYLLASGMTEAQVDALVARLVG